ncbi:hypothetical protein C8J56DRAFT_902769 [Mycena floridula]|nr:hypothetical protein C8J56DRAFT_902769 [Mycena floridula]
MALVLNFQLTLTELSAMDTNKLKNVMPGFIQTNFAANLPEFPNPNTSFLSFVPETKSHYFNKDPEYPEKMASGAIKVLAEDFPMFMYSHDGKLGQGPLLFQLRSSEDWVKELLDIWTKQYCGEKTSRGRAAAEDSTEPNPATLPNFELPERLRSSPDQLLVLSRGLLFELLCIAVCFHHCFWYLPIVLLSPNHLLVNNSDSLTKNLKPADDMHLEQLELQTIQYSFEHPEKFFKAYCVPRVFCSLEGNMYSPPGPGRMMESRLLPMNGPELLIWFGGFKAIMSAVVIMLDLYCLGCVAQQDGSTSTFHLFANAFSFSSNHSIIIYEH